MARPRGRRHPIAVTHPDPTKIQRWRLKAGIGQEEVARKTGYARASVSAIENGKLPAHRRFLSALQREFGVDPATFYVLVMLALVGVVTCCLVCGRASLLGLEPDLDGDGRPDHGELTQ